MGRRFERDREILILQRCGAKVHEGAPSFRQTMTRHASGETERTTSGLCFCGHCDLHNVQLLGDSNKPLCQCVVHLASEASSFLKH